MDPALDEGTRGARPAAGDTLVCRFTAVTAAVTFLGALTEHTGRAAPACRNSPQDGSWWITLPDGGPAEAAVAELTGGIAYLSRGGRATRTSPAFARGAAAQVPDALYGWPEVSWIDLVARLAGARRDGRPAEITVFAGGGRARWITQRSGECAAEVFATPVTLAPVAGISHARAADERRVMRLRIRAAGKALPVRLLDALLALPDIEVCRREERLLMPCLADYPIPDQVLAARVPAGRHWLVAADNAGVWEVHESTGVHEFAALPRLAEAPPRIPSRTREGWDSHLATTVRVVAAASDGRSADAVLVSDADLPAIRAYLGAQPADDALHLVPGDGLHLLTEPGGLTRTLPFGIALHRIGPGGLYLQTGHRLAPALAPAARSRLFGIDDASVVAVCAHRSLRFALQHTRPVWLLWLGAGPRVESGLSTTGRRLLDALDRLPGDAPAPDAPLSEYEAPGGHAEQLAEALLDQESGRIDRAARNLENAGHFQRAARMYELAAREAAAGPRADEGGGP
ncbi:hypothetical protein ACFYW8_21730 [Streptomyces sp. NPDC002742]|uniref:hypothetical protein n=1 Tax=Streptomyces sp. NPDC002742 TaxID=3364663 RepID=UPI00368EDC1F